MNTFAKFGVAACLVVSFVISQTAAADTAEDFRTAKTVKEAQKAGGQQISGASIMKIMSGRTFKNPDWTWRVKKNGTHTSKATDGSWSDKGTWEVRGNQYCRQSQATKGKTICSNVYFLGKDLRLSQHANPRKLLDWHVSF